MRTDTAIGRPADLTAEWLSAVLAVEQVTAFSPRRIGTGQMSECYRVALTYREGTAGPQSVVLKVAAGDPISRQTGLALGLYEREVRFYTEIAPRLDGPLARCHHAAFDPATGVFHLILDDDAHAATGDEIHGATLHQATLAVTELARIQGPLLGDQALADAPWLTGQAPTDSKMLAKLYAGFTERYADTMSDEQRVVCQRLVGEFHRYIASQHAGRLTGLVHGDFRLDNLLFGVDDSPRPLTVLDWQTVKWGPPLTDLAYFLGGSLPMGKRREHYDTLLAAYHRALGPDPALTFNEVRDQVRQQSFFGVMMTIVSSMLVERTPRGDEMFMTMLQRHCSHVLDTDALAMLNRPAVPVPGRPRRSDEAVHRRGDEPLWNESWYFDFVDVAQGVGGWIRLGLYPNQGRAWINALFCGPGMPTVALNNFEVAIPANAHDVHAAGVALTHSAIEPLQSYRVTLRGCAQAYDDPAGLLREREGQPVDVMVDLTWRTDGTPYQYRIATRYEIPCAVSGTLLLDGRTYRVDAQLGQRDHSWGVRDWWSADWMWSALHLDDGTHLHAVDIRVGGASQMGIGYLQRSAAPLIELQAAQAREAFAPDGLPTAARIRLDPGGLEVDITPLGHAPVRLVGRDGRVSQFVRAWAAVRTDDGRTGSGWIEWNRNL